MTICSLVTLALSIKVLTYRLCTIGLLSRKHNLLTAMLFVNEGLQDNKLTAAIRKNKMPWAAEKGAARGE